MERYVHFATAELENLLRAGSVRDIICNRTNNLDFNKVLQDNNSDILGITRNYYKKTRTKDKDYWLKLDIKSNIKFNINKKGLIYDVERES